MREIKIGGKDYKIEFSFGAVEDGKLVSEMFRMLSGSYFATDEDDERTSTQIMVDASAMMMGNAPGIGKRAFKTGLKEHHPELSSEEKDALLKEYIKESKKNLVNVYEEMRDCMEEDGFFDLSGITERIEEMLKEVENQQKLPIEPQDHKKKQTTGK